MMSSGQLGVARAVAAASFFACLGIAAVPAQQLDASSVIQHIDAAVKARVDNIEGYTVTEHYAVYRSNDEAHPVAEMTVKTLYQKDTGKSYTILSQTGSEGLPSPGFGPVPGHAKRLALP